VQGTILIMTEVEVEPELEEEEADVGSIVLQFSVRQLSASNSWPTAFMCTSSWQVASGQQERVHVVMPPIFCTVTLHPWLEGVTQAALGMLAASPALQASAAAPFWVLMATHVRHSETVAWERGTRLK